MYDTQLTESEYTANLESILRRTRQTLDQYGSSHNWQPTTVAYFRRAVEEYYADTGKWPNEDEAATLFALVLRRLKEVATQTANVAALSMTEEEDAFLGKVFRKWANPKKERKGLGKFFQNIGKGIGKAGLGVGKVLTWVAVRPFRGAMLKGLEAAGVRGYTKNTPLPDLAKAFIKFVVKRERPDLVPPELEDTFERDTIEPVTISAIVTAIIAFIKGLKKKKEDGQPLTKSQKAIVDVAETVEDRAYEIADEEVSFQLGDWIRQNLALVLVGAAVLIFGFVYLAGKKG